MPFSWAFVRPALLASGHKKTTELVDSPWFVLIKPTFVRLGCGKTGIRTLGARKGTTVFETAPIDHSGIFPFGFCECKYTHFFLSDKTFSGFLQIISNKKARRIYLKLLDLCCRQKNIDKANDIKTIFTRMG